MLAPESAIRPATAAIADAPVDVDGHAEGGGRLLDGGTDLLGVAGRGHEHPEDQPSPEHDLLDVDHLDARPGQGGEHRGGHTGAVLARQRDEEGLRLLALRYVS